MNNLWILRSSSVLMLRDGFRLRRRFSLTRLRLASGYCTSSKLFVGGLSYDTNETILKEAFGEYGEVVEAKVICDHVSGKSKGYAFVRFTSKTAAETAFKEMNGQPLDGRNIRVHFANRE